MQEKTNYYALKIRIFNINQFNTSNMISREGKIEKQAFFVVTDRKMITFKQLTLSFPRFFMKH